MCWFSKEWGKDSVCMNHQTPSPITWGNHTSLNVIKYMLISPYAIHSYNIYHANWNCCLLINVLSINVKEGSKPLITCSLVITPGKWIMKYPNVMSYIFTWKAKVNW